MNLNKIKSIAKKEFYHIFRDPFTLGTVLLIPAFLVIIFGFAIDFNIKNVKLGAINYQNSDKAKSFISKISSSNFFEIETKTSLNEGFKAIENNSLKGIIYFDNKFEKTNKSQIILDGSDNQTTGTIASYIGAFYSQNDHLTTTRFLYNSELKSAYFVVSGLSVVILSILSILLTAMTIAREWENGSMELLLSTPVKQSEIILGKIIPYAILGLVAKTLILIIALTIFDLPFRGNLIVYYLGTSLFLIAALSQGVLISILTKTQQIAMQFAMISGFLPGILLSGFIFPIESMPKIFQYITYILPARWFIEISRDSYLKGSSFSALIPSFAALTAIGLFLFIVSMKKFKRSLE